MPFYTEFYNLVHKILKKDFNSFHDFLNYCHLNNKDGDPIYFDEYYKLIKGNNDDWEQLELKIISKYIFTLNFHSWIGNPKAQSINTYKKLLNFIWNDKRLQQSPQNNSAIELTDKKDDENNVILRWRGGDFVTNNLKQG